MIVASRFRRELKVVEPRCGVAIRVRDHFHDQHTIEKIVWMRHAHADFRQSAQRGCLGVLPQTFLLFAAVARAFFHRAGTTAIFDFAAFGVLRRLTETAFGCEFVDFRAANFFATADQINRCFFAALELADDFVDETFFDE